MPGFPCSSRAGHSLFARIQGEPALLRGVCCLQGARLQAQQGGHPRVPEGPPCTLGDANQHRITWKVGQRGRPRAPCTRRRTAVSYMRASRRMTVTADGARRGSRAQCRGRGLSGGTGVHSWQHKYLITGKASAAAALAHLTV